MAVGWSGADPVEDSDTADYELGVEMVANVDITITHVRVFGTPLAEDQPSRQGKIWNTTLGTVLATATMPTTLLAGWNSYALSVPLERTAGQRWLVSYSTGGHYGFISSALGSNVTSGDGAVTFLSHTNSTAGNGRINVTPGSYPTSATAGTFWGVDVQYTLGVGNTAPSITALSLTTPGDGFTVDAAITATDPETLVSATYAIDWGDGTITSASSGSHTYATSGLKAVLGSVTDSGGLSDYAAAAIQLTEPGTLGLDVVEIQGALLSHALTLGLFASVNGFEPKAAPMDGIHGALWVASIEPARGRSGLNSTTMRLTYNFRVGVNMLAEPQDDIDPRILVATAALMRQYSGDFQLGGAVKNVDLLGETGPPLAAQAGYLNQDSKLFRVMVITIPLIINDVFLQAP